MAAPWALKNLLPWLFSWALTVASAVAAVVRSLGSTIVASGKDEVRASAQPLHAPARIANAMRSSRGEPRK